MKSGSLIIIAILLFHSFVYAQRKVTFVEEHIDFSLDSDYFSINGIFSFANESDKSEIQQIMFPFASDSAFIDSIRIVNLNTLTKVEFKKLKRAVVFELVLPANDTLDLNLFYRQKSATTNRYIITSTKAWGEPLKRAVYSLAADKSLHIDSFTYKPDSTHCINNTRIFLWEMHCFMPDKEFEITLTDNL